MLLGLMPASGGSITFDGDDLEALAASGEILVVTKNGKPVAELHPYQGARASSPFGLHPGVRILGDIVSPVADEDWEALS